MLALSKQENVTKFVDKLSKFDLIFLELEGVGTQQDLVSYERSFFEDGVVEASIDQNANIRSTNVYTFFSEFPKIFLKELSLYLIYDRISQLFGEQVADEFLKQEITGGIYVHDLFHAAFQPYCYAYSVGEIVRSGLQFIQNIKSAPAKHLNTFIQHVIQFIMFASNQQSGAVGLPDLFVWMWYYVKKDLETGYIPKDNWQEHVKQTFQVFTYSINQPIRGTQSPYVNVTYLDREHIKAIFANEAYPDSTKILDELENIIHLQKMYWTWVAQERKLQMFTFPVATAALLFKDGKFVDEDSAKFVVKANMQWYDTNFYVSDSVDAVASCCRLQSSMKKILFDNRLTGVSNSIGGSGLNIGSFKVVTINLPRIALESHGDLDAFKRILEDRVKLCMKTLAAIRSILKDRIDKGVLPLYTHKLLSLERQYGTVGITGVWECAQLMDKNFTHTSVDGAKYTPQGEQFVTQLLDLIADLTDQGRYEFEFTFNIEQVPAEKAAVTLAEKDKVLFNVPYTVYSNQWVPLSVNTDMTNRILYSGMWDKKVNGGAIMHINLGSPLEDEQEMFEMVCDIAKRGVKYFAFNTKISICENNHGFYGDVCPICGKHVIDHVLRIVGYLVPTKAFNKIRRETELPNRQFYNAQN